MNFCPIFKEECRGDDCFLSLSVGNDEGYCMLTLVLFKCLGVSIDEQLKEVERYQSGEANIETD